MQLQPDQIEEIIQRTIQRSLTGKTISKHYTITEICELYGISRDTFWRWEKGGYITPVILPGGMKRYRAEDVRKLGEKKEKRIKEKV